MAVLQRILKIVSTRLKPAGCHWRGLRSPVFVELTGGSKWPRMAPAAKASLNGFRQSPSRLTTENGSDSLGEPTDPILPRFRMARKDLNETLEIVRKIHALSLLGVVPF